MTAQAPRVALYTRISATDKDVDKPENQRLRLVDFADAKGYTVVDTFTDDGISAYIDDTVRPGFNAMAAGIRAGKYDLILATGQQRLGRNVAEWEPVIKLFKTSGVLYETIFGGGPWDMRLADHVKYSRTKVVDASGEVETRMELQHARTKDELRAGNSLWGPRPFGFTTSKGQVDGIHEGEQATIVKAAHDVLHGVSLYKITQDWNAAGLKSPRGKEWSQASVRSVLMRPRNAGWLTYKGEFISRTLPELMPESDWQNVVDFLSDPTRAPKRGPKQKAMLSGIIRCVCGRPMTADYSRGRYKCTQRVPGSTGHIEMDFAEQVTEDAVLGAIMDGLLDGPEDLGELVEVQEKITAVTRKLDAANDVLMDPDIADKARAKKRVLELEAERNLLLDERASLVAQRAQGSAFDEFREYLANQTEDDPAADSAAVDRLSEAWLALPLERKRVIIKGSFVVSLADGLGAGRVSVEPS